MRPYPTLRKLAILTGGSLALLGGLFLLFLGLDKLSPLPLSEVAPSRVVVDRQGIPLRTFADKEGIWRYPVTLEEVSPYYLEALITYEDRHFWSHWGINPASILRAAYLNIREGRVVSGGSTLTMQVARLLDPHSKRLSGKLKQAFRALQLEWHLSKREILTLYLNRAPFGGTLQGVQAASYSYLGKPVSDLTPAEAALLAVLPQAPSYYRPDRYPERAQHARDKVLQRLAHQGVWSQAQVAQALQDGVSARTPERPLLAPLLAERLIAQSPELQIKTTIDAHLQQSLQDYLANHIQHLPKHSTAAAIVIDNRSQQVLAYVGNAAYGDTQRFGYIDMIQAIRSPGSTLKPFLYGLAIDEGLIHAQSLMTDAPLNYGDYRPQNFDRGFVGPISATQALQHSLNVTAVQLLEHYGPKRFYAKLENAGIDLQLTQGEPNLSIILGGLGTNLWNLAQGYTSLSQGGQVQKLRVRFDDVAQSRPLLSDGSAWVIYDILRQQLRPDHLPTNNIRQDKVLAWKTGTSYGHRDAWALGISPQYTLGVWVGRPDGTPLPGHYGAMTATPILTTLYDALPKDNLIQDNKPKSVTSATICWPLGTEKTAQTQAYCQKEFTSWIVDNQIPPTLPELDSFDYQSNPIQLWINPNNGRRVSVDCALPMQAVSYALWPLALEPWIPYQKRRQAILQSYDPNCPAQQVSLQRDLKIIGIKDGNRFKQSPGSDYRPQITLQAIGGEGTQHWYINGRYLSSVSNGQGIRYRLTQKGHYQLMVSDDFAHLDRVEIDFE